MTLRRSSRTLDSNRDRSRVLTTFRLLIAAGLVSAAAGAQTITLGELTCLPAGENGVVTARVDPGSVRAELTFAR